MNWKPAVKQSGLAQSGLREACLQMKTKIMLCSNKLTQQPVQLFSQCKKWCNRRESTAQRRAIILNESGGKFEGQHWWEASTEARETESTVTLWRNIPRDGWQDLMAQSMATKCELCQFAGNSLHFNTYCTDKSTESVWANMWNITHSAFLFCKISFLFVAIFNYIKFHQYFFSCTIGIQRLVVKNPAALSSAKVTSLSFKPNRDYFMTNRNVRT